jgi:hypothetical protein
MKAILISLFLISSQLIFAQSNLTVFNNDGKQFYVILNGIKQNAQPQTNVVVSGIKNGTYAMKLIFADGVTKDIDKNFWLETPSDITAKVFFKKGVGKVQLTAPVPATTSAGSGSVVYRPNDQAIYSDQQTVQTTQTTTTTTTSSSSPQVSNSQTGGNANIQINASQQGTQQSSNNQSVSTTQTTNSSSSQTGTGGVNVSINVNDPTNAGGGINMNMNVTDPTMQNSSTGMTTGANTQGGAGGVNMNVNVTDPTMQNGTTGMNTGVNTNNGSGGVNMNMNVNGNMNGGVGTTVNSGSSSQTSSSSTTITTTTTTVSTTGKPSGNTTTNNTTGTTSNNTVKPGTCKTILGDDAAYVKKMKETTFEDDRVESIQTDFTNQCLVASQAYKIIETLTFSSNRLEMSKYLYLRIIDKDKGNVLLPLFTFDSEKEEFTEYMKTIK